MEQRTRTSCDSAPHFHFIELLAYWQGKVNSSDLRRQFAISRQQATHYLQMYRTVCPQNLHYQSSVKGFEPASDFAPRYISGDVSEYLDWLDHQGNITVSQASTGLTHTALTLPKRQVSPMVMRALVAAIRRRQRLDVEYLSLSNPVNEGRVIQPHTFVKTGLRWHLRAYCEQTNEFRDFVLSRFRGEPELLGPADHSAADDPGWNSELKLILVPDPALSDAQQQVVAEDYQMQNGRLVIRTKPALAQYLLQEMQIDLRGENSSPTARQLRLLNVEALRPWLFSLRQADTCQPS